MPSERWSGEGKRLTGTVLVYAEERDENLHALLLSTDEAFIRDYAKPGQAVLAYERDDLPGTDVYGLCLPVERRHKDVLDGFPGVDIRAVGCHKDAVRCSRAMRGAIKSYYDAYRAQERPEPITPRRAHARSIPGHELERVLLHEYVRPMLHLRSQDRARFAQYAAQLVEFVSGDANLEGVARSLHAHLGRDGPVSESDVDPYIRLLVGYATEQYGLCRQAHDEILARFLAETAHDAAPVGGRG